MTPVRDTQLVIDRRQVHGVSQAHTSGGFLPLRDLPQQIARGVTGPLELDES